MQQILTMEEERQPGKVAEASFGRGDGDGDGDDAGRSDDAGGANVDDDFEQDAGNLAHAALARMGTADGSTVGRSVLGTSECAATPVAANLSLAARAGGTADGSAGGSNIFAGADHTAAATTHQRLGWVDVGGPSPLAMSQSERQRRRLLHNGGAHLLPPQQRGPS